MPELVYENGVRLYLPNGAIDLQQGPRPATEELGATGTGVFGGQLTEQDYNTDLQGEALYTIYDRMRKADSQIRAGLRAIKLPLLRAEWSVEPASDEPRDVEIAEFVEHDLFHMTMSWMDVLRQILLMLDYGSYPFEIVWEIGQDKRAHLAKLAPRHPRTVLRWLIDDKGDYDGIEQLVLNSAGAQTVTIPASKTVVFVNEREGSDMRGTSIMRAIYRNWAYKDRLLAVDGIQKEKRGLGVDVGTVGSTGGGDLQARKRDMEKALMTLHAHEKQFFAEIEGQTKYRVEGVAGELASALESVEYHDLQILRSMLAEFIAIGGKDAAGSRALHTDKTSFFILSLGELGANVTWTADVHLIRKMVDFNFGPQQDYPHLRHSRLDTRQNKELAEALEKFVGSGLLTPTREDEAEIRSGLDFPELPDDRESAADLPADEVEEPEFDVTIRNLAAHPVRPRRRRRRRRDQTEAEQRVDFKVLEIGLDSAAAKIAAAVRATQVKQIDNLVAEGKRVFERGDAASVENVTVRHKAELATTVSAILGELFDLGRQEAARELRTQGLSVRLAQLPLEPENVNQVRAYLAMLSRTLTSLMADRLRSSFLWEMMAQIRAGAFDQTKLTGTLRALSDREIVKTAGGTVTTALNLGRQSIALQHEERIQKAIFSSVLDTGTCVPCENADGEDVQVGDERYEWLEPPFRECQGRGRCRCVFVFVLREEVPAVV